MSLHPVYRVEVLAAVAEDGAETWATTVLPTQHPSMLAASAEGLDLDEALELFCAAVRRGGVARIVCESVDGPTHETVIASTGGQL